MLYQGRTDFFKDSLMTGTRTKSSEEQLVTVRILSRAGDGTIGL